MNGCDAIRAARELVPWWVTWGAAIVYPLVSFVLMLFFGQMGLAWIARPLLLAPSAHWTERARHLQRIRNWLKRCAYMGCVWAMLLAFAAHSSLSPVSSAAQAFASAVLVYLAWMILILRAERRYGGENWRQPHPVRRLGAHLVLFTALRWVVMALALFLPEQLDATTLTVAVLATLAGIFLLIGGGIRVLSLLGIARRARLGELGIKSRSNAEGVLPFNTVWLFESPYVNAVAWPLVREVGITEAAVSLLTPAELASVLRHEAAHLSEPFWHHVVRTLPGLLLLSLGWWSPISSHFGMSAVALLASALLISSAWARYLGRNAERHADAKSSGGGINMLDYARALERTYVANLAPAVIAKTSSHPSLWERMVASGVRPAWPRPAVLPGTPKGFMLLLVGTTVIVYMSPRVLLKTALEHRHERSQALLALAFFGGQNISLNDLGSASYREHHWADSVALFLSAAEARPDAPDGSANAAIALCRLCACEEAQAELTEAERRSEKSADPSRFRPLLDRASAEIAACQRGLQH